MSGRSVAARTLKFSSIFIVLLFLLAALALCGCGDGSSQPLFVADSGNNRVLIYNSPFTTGQNANLVLGQQGFITATAGTGATVMTQPGAVALDSNGNLYVAESATTSGTIPFITTTPGRVLQFKPPFTSGMPATAVIGATDMNTAGTVFYPNSIALDAQNNVWVADTKNGQVSKFVAPITCTPCPTTPALVVGSGILLPGSPGNSTPMGVAFDRSGNLWVADGGNNRVVEFAQPLSAGSAVALHIGDQTGIISGTELLGPTAVAFDNAGNLWVADTGNNRVVEFRPAIFQWHGGQHGNRTN